MLPFKRNSVLTKTLGISSLLFSGLLSISGEAEAVAVRIPDESLTDRQSCIDKYGFMTFFAASGGLSLSGDNDPKPRTLCINRRDALNDTLPAAPAVFSYARDNLKLYYPIHTAIKQVVRYNFPPQVPYKIGHTFEHSLRKIAVDHDGVPIWSVGAPNDMVGIKLWSSSSCGPDPISHAKRPANGIQDSPFTVPGWDNDNLRGYSAIPGDAIDRSNAGCNFFARIVSEVVLLKPDAINGRVTIPHQQLGTIKMQSANFDRIVGKIDTPVYLDAMNFEFKARTCSYLGQKDRTVKLDKIGIGHFANGRNEVYGGTTTINLTCPADSNVHSFVTFTDNANVNNTSNILSLSQGSTARNVGIKVYVNDDTEAVKYGPLVLQEGTEGTRGRAIAKQSYSREVAPASNVAQTHSLKLTAKYARTNNRPIQPGKVNGEMIFNFSYY